MLSIVVPTYNSQQHIKIFFLKVHALFNERNIAHEFVFVDDCSKDDSWMIIKGMIEKHSPLIKGIRLNRNRGQHLALMTGLKYVTYDVVVTSDVDLHVPVYKLFELYNTLTDTVSDFTYLSYIRSYPDKALNLLSALFNLIYHQILGVNHYSSNYKSIRKSLVVKALQYDFDYVFIDTFLFMRGKGVPVFSDYYPKRFKYSGYTYSKKIKLAVNVLTTAVWKKLCGFRKSDKVKPSVIAEIYI